MYVKGWFLSRRRDIDIYKYVSNKYVKPKIENTTIIDGEIDKRLTAAKGYYWVSKYFNWDG